MMDNRVVYINGEYIAEDKAAISPFSRGLMYGDGIFETFRAYSGRVFALENHFTRLVKSAGFFRISLPFDVTGLSEIISELMNKNSLADKDSRIRLTLIRAAAGKGLFPVEEAGSEVIISIEGVTENIETMQREGTSLVLINKIRVDHKSPLAEHKTLNYMPGIAGMMEAVDSGGDEGLFLNYDENVVEGVTSNVFIVQGGELLTPPLSAGLLPGITREVVIDLAEKAGIKCEQRVFGMDEMNDAEEIFITSSVREIVPVRLFEGRELGIGEVTRRLQREYKAYVSKQLLLPFEGRRLG